MVRGKLNAKLLHTPKPWKVRSNSICLIQPIYPIMPILSSGLIFCLPTNDESNIYSHLDLVKYFAQFHDSWLCTKAIYMRNNYNPRILWIKLEAFDYFGAPSSLNLLESLQCILTCNNKLWKVFISTDVELLSQMSIILYVLMDSESMRTIRTIYLV